MRELIGSMLDNDSAFGRLMTKLGVMIGANIMFVFFSMPVITIGPAFVALYHVMLKSMRGDGVINPFKEYWKAFRSNFKQSMILWGSAMLLALFFFVDFRIVYQASGFIQGFRYPLFALTVILICLLIYTSYAMAAFEDSIPHLVRNAIFLMMKNPIALVTILFFHIFPMYLTYSDPQMMPLYGFIWVTFGFGAIAKIGAAFLMPIIEPYMPVEEEDFIPDEPTEEEILEMMLKLGM